MSRSCLVRATHEDIVDRFSWTSWDVHDLLPPDWRESILAIAERGVHRLFVPCAGTSREADRFSPLPICEVDGDVIRRELPWLHECYRGVFHELARRSCKEEVFTASCDRYGVILNVLRGQQMRYPCHVDSNPLAGLLYVTGHSPGTGGELVVAKRRAAASAADVDEDCATVHPTAGHLLFFDGRFHPHYVRPLREEHGIRVVVAMNYYTPTQPESTRPADLDSGVVVDRP